MCEHCDYEQALTDIETTLRLDPHILDQARLERIRSWIKTNNHVTPMQKREIVSLEAEARGEVE